MEPPGLGGRPEQPGEDQEPSGDSNRASEVVRRDGTTSQRDDLLRSRDVETGQNTRNDKCRFMKKTCSKA